MIFERNERKRIELINQKGEKEEFLYSVDAKEALMLKDKEGNQRYTLPEKKVEKIANIKTAKEKDAEEDALSKLKTPVKEKVE